ncbi:hypothetical protein ACIP1G_23565, partial [Pseudomonas sp. NPDC089392]|uniref:hypothetical protein n=1 Tax=Pseudomonas sp. NPDC089392 TaxID=3364459 RepID=UPI003802C6CE
GRARLAQDGLARNKRRSGFSREAPRGRRSISQALKTLRRTPAALDLAGAKCVEANASALDVRNTTKPKATTCQPHPI